MPLGTQDHPVHKRFSDAFQELDHSDKNLALIVGSKYPVQSDHKQDENVQEPRLGYTYQSTIPC